MIAAWMLYCVLCAAGLGVAAVLVERALLAGRAPVRQIWVGAILMAMIIPASAFRYAAQHARAAESVIVIPDGAAEPLGNVVVATSGPAPVAVTQPSQRTGWSWRATIGTVARANQSLVIAWIVLSMALATYFLVGIVTLGWMRTRWQRRDVLGVPVLVSERTGPAVVGAVAPAIVMPEWALAMEPHQVSLMLRHEEEHRRAGDAQLLIAAQLVLIAMPWNVGLWWLIVRLGMAVELDCDARVLRDADARSYGDLLLEVARPRRGPRLIAATAFAERAGQLERRIRAIASRRERASRGARAGAALVVLGAITIAWTAPYPAALPRAARQISAPSAVLSVADPRDRSTDVFTAKDVKQALPDRETEGADAAEGSGTG